MKKNLLLICSFVLLGGLSLLNAQTYVGSETCGNCHSENYANWLNSGHPYKFSVIENDEAPTYPDFVTNFEDTWLTDLADGSITWADVAGVIGGYGWKARFVGDDGIIIGTASSAYYTEGHNQFNFFGGEAHGWVDYSVSSENKAYNYGCFKCHTTGGDTTGTWLTGVDGLGTFTEGGIGCEGCHGPGSDHAANPSVDNIDLVYEMAHLDNTSGGLSVGGVVQTPNPDGDDVNFMCGTCHNRSYTDPINSSGGFIKHHEQWDELTASGMSGLTCITCHDPHKKVLWDGDGITKTCNTCHGTIEVTHHNANATCIECHMPFAAKSGTTRGESGYKADVRSHLFNITVDTNGMFTDDGSAVRDDDTREASLSLHFVCLGCHNDDPNDDIPEMTIAEAAQYAAGMHTPNAVAEVENLKVGVFPNPVVDNASMSFNLSSAQNVRLEIVNVAGQLVYSENMNKPAGRTVVTWNGTSNSGVDVNAGIYFVKVEAGNLSSMEKLILAK